jgi:hypothetical protein
MTPNGPRLDDISFGPISGSEAGRSRECAGGFFCRFAAAPARFSPVEDVRIAN